MITECCARSDGTLGVPRCRQKLNGEGDVHKRWNDNVNSPMRWGYGELVYAVSVPSVIS
jgi:hypothetical protein